MLLCLNFRSSLKESSDFTTLSRQWVPSHLKNAIPPSSSSTADGGKSPVSPKEVICTFPLPCLVLSKSCLCAWGLEIPNGVWSFTMRLLGEDVHTDLVYDLLGISNLCKDVSITSRTLLAIIASATSLAYSFSSLLLGRNKHMANILHLSYTPRPLPYFLLFFLSTLYSRLKPGKEGPQAKAIHGLFLIWCVI